MQQSLPIFRRVLLAAAVLLASVAALGFSQSVSPTRSGHSSDYGVLVISVPSGSPADKAGLARGDIILNINGSAVNSARELHKAILSHTQGDTVSLMVWHGDKTKTIPVVLGGRDGSAYLGARLLPDARERISMLGPGHVEWSRELSEGAFIAHVASTGPAYKAGIRQGDVILAVNGMRVGTDRSFKTLIQDKKIGETVTLSVRSDKEPMYGVPEAVKVTLGSTPMDKPWIGVGYRMANSTALAAPWSGFPRVASFLKDLGILHAPQPTA
jgi:S1-C subfamily serine protease